MGMTIETRAESGLLHVVATGEFSLEEAKRTFLEMLEAARKHQVEKIFFDGRKIVGEPEIMERFFYGKFAAQSVKKFADRGTQFAYVLLEPVLDPERFGEKVARNRGMFVKTFDNVEEAMAWLETASGKTDKGAG